MRAGLSLSGRFSYSAYQDERRRRSLFNPSLILAGQLFAPRRPAASPSKRILLWYSSAALKNHELYFEFADSGHAVLNRVATWGDDTNLEFNPPRKFAKWKFND